MTAIAFSSQMASLIPPPPQVLDESELQPIQKAVVTYLAAESLLKRSYSEASRLDRHSGEPVRALVHLSLTVGRFGRREEAVDLINQAWEKARRMEHPRRMLPLSEAFSSELKLAVILKDPGLIETAAEKIPELDKSIRDIAEQELSKAKQAMGSPTGQQAKSSDDKDTEPDITPDSRPEAVLARTTQTVIHLMASRMRDAAEMLLLTRRYSSTPFGVKALAEKKFTATLNAPTTIEDPNIRLEVQVAMAKELVEMNMISEAEQLFSQAMHTSNSVSNPEERALFHAPFFKPILHLYWHRMD